MTKKQYYIPVTEVVCFEMQVPVALASSKTEVPGAPARLQGAPPSGSVKAF